MKKINGIIYALLSSAAFGIMPIFAKYAANNGSNTLSILSTRFLLSALILFVYFLFKKVNYKIDKNQLKALAVVSLCGFVPTASLLFFSYNYIPTGLATTLHFIYPAVVVAINRIFFKDPLTKNKLISLFLSMISIYLLVGFKFENINIIGVVLALASGFTHSISIFGMNNSALKTLDNLVSVFYISIFAGITIFTATAITGNIALPINTYTVTSLIGISLISNIASILLLMMAIKIIGPSPSAILGTFEPIVSIIMGIILFKEAFTFSVFLGTVLILVSVVLLAKEKPEKELQVEILKEGKEEVLGQ
ncbi:DMT family transporter [Clostridium sp. UBA4548]|uniref:DMT family transporter n=1 Tax=Clostridium sp. UBA4548 TaxID=1946361 RepID=UPI0025BA3626|nr:DMT family transporter [Clostridium sp. UBA4548]